MTDGRLRKAAQRAGAAVDCTAINCNNLTASGMYCTDCQAMIDRLTPAKVGDLIAAGKLAPYKTHSPEHKITTLPWKHSGGSTPRPSHYKAPVRIIDIVPPSRPRVTGSSFGSWYCAALVVVIILGAMYALVAP